MPSQPESEKPRLVRCPTCAGESIYARENPYRPFCCERCKNLDLGTWASEGFRLPDKDSSNHRPTGDSELQ